MKHVLRRTAFFFRYAWLFSLFVNLAMLTLPLYMLQVYDRVLASRSLPTLAMLTLGAAFVYAVYVGLEMLRSRVLVQASVALDRLLGAQVLGEVFARAAQPLGERHAGAVRDVATLRQYVTGSGLFAFFDAPWSLVFLAIIFAIHPWLGATALLGMLVLLALALADERRTRPLLLQANALARQAGRDADAAVRQAEAVEAMGMRAAVVARWSARNDEVLRAQSQASDRSGSIVATSKGLRQLLQVAMLGLGAYLVITQHLSAGTMIAATILLARATAPLELAIAGWRGFVDARAAYARLAALVDRAPSAAAALELPAPRGAVEVDRIVVAPVADRPPVLKGVSFDVAAGECVAVIGPSAAGKSTLLRALLGLWRPQSGCVRLDGADVADWPRESLAPHVGYLPQDVELLAGTVAENIARMGPMPQSSQAVVAAATLAGAHEMILKLPGGYDTVIGDAATVLSGGQRQRIGLARALFGPPKLVVLDEPNSNLDTDGEAALMAAIRALKAMGSTVVFVTHKPSLLADADRVLVLHAGSVAAFGPRDEVLAKVSGRPVRDAQPATAT